MPKILFHNYNKSLYHSRFDYNFILVKEIITLRTGLVEIRKYWWSHHVLPSKNNETLPTSDPISDMNRYPKKRLISDIHTPVPRRRLRRSVYFYFRYREIRVGLFFSSFVELC